VYFTSIIRDEKGRKMSKSLGNSPDPIDVINEYGADALRFTIAYLSPLGQDVLFSAEKCELGRNFANKIWNAGRFLLMNKAELLSTVSDRDKSSLGRETFENFALETLPTEHLDLADKWILSRLNHAIKDYNDALTSFRINDSTKVLYDFVWHDFCDWYVELAKTRFYGDEPADVKKIVVQRALWIFDRALRMLHPHMPFVTEELWQHLTDRKGQSIMRAEFPVADEKQIDRKTETDMTFVQEVINAIRNIRGENNIPPSKEINVQILSANDDRGSVIKTYGAYLKKLGRVENVEMIAASAKPKLASSAVVDGIELFVPLAGLIDVTAERKRLEKEIARLQQLIDTIEKKLNNPMFSARAPKDVVEKEREKQANFKANIEKLQSNLKHLTA
jgi:valyl-tRNA synthetase